LDERQGGRWNESEAEEGGKKADEGEVPKPRNADEGEEHEREVEEDEALIGRSSSRDG
jgi:hypothetical protein